MLNKKDSTPLYIQLKRLIREQIIEGKIEEMEFLPSEKQLMQKYSITRTTIRKAISELKQEGLVQQIQGKGVYVKVKELKETVWNFHSFSDLAASYNKKPVTKVLKKENILYENQMFLKLVRLRGFEMIDKVTWITLETSCLPLWLFEGIDNYNFSLNSIYKLMKEKYSVYPYYANMDIVPIESNYYLKNKFELSTKQPLLKSIGKVFTENEREIEKLEIIYSPHFKFKLSQYIDR